jgi:hypothetical protein
VAALTIFETGTLSGGAEFAAVVLIVFGNFRAGLERTITIGMSTGFLSHGRYLHGPFGRQLSCHSHCEAAATLCPDVWKNARGPNV